VTPLGRTLLRWLAALVAVSAAMGLLQWLAAPQGYGASAWANALPQMGHPALGRVLLALSNSAAHLRGVDRFWQHTLNAPRNELLHAVHAVVSVDYYAVSERVGYWPDVRDALLLIAGTIIVYLPLVAGLALIRNGWPATKTPASIAALLFVVVAIGYVVLFKDATPAYVLTALSLLTASVGLLWSPALSRHSRIVALGTLLIASSIVGMLSVTMGHGPRDALSYPTFFVWSLVVLLMEGAPFLLLVWLATKALARRDRSTRHEVQPD